MPRRLAVSSPSVNTSDDLPARDFVQHVDAGIDRVVQSRRVAELQILERADQVVAIAREGAAELDLVAEGADLSLVVGQHPEDELFGRRFEQIEVGGHARAEVEHDDDGERLRLVLEERDLLRLPVVENRELVLLEARDRAVPVRPVTVESMATMLVPDLKVACCARTAAPARTTNAETRNGRVSPIGGA